MSESDDYKLQSQKVTQEVLARLLQSSRCVEIIKAPPGAGKTHSLIEIIRGLQQEGHSVAVATCTNNQADQVCERYANTYKEEIFRLVSNDDFKKRGGHGEDKNIPLIANFKEVDAEASIFVGTAASWGLKKVETTFDFLICEESWQLKWADFALLQNLTENYVFIGDPGQIDPVVTIPVERWETSLVQPYLAAPELIIQRNFASCHVSQLPATWRLPLDSSRAVQSFYDFSFGAVAEAGARKFIPGKSVNDQHVKSVIESLQGGSISFLPVPVDAQMQNIINDPEVASRAVEIATGLLDCKAKTFIDGKEEKFEPSDIGIVATHRVLVSQIAQGLPGNLAKHIKVDTPERWQGLQNKIMIVVHPLSSVSEPSGFDLNSGRLCVMASRHQVGVIIIGRDHIGNLLNSHFPPAEQAPSQPDEVGRGHDNHLRFWDYLRRNERIMGAV